MKKLFLAMTLALAVIVSASVPSADALILRRWGYYNYPAYSYYYPGYSSYYGYPGYSYYYTPGYGYYSNYGYYYPTYGYRYGLLRR